MVNWDSAQYQIFLGERMLPNEELIGKVGGMPTRIVDMGCGAGDCSTFALRKRFPTASIRAFDTSEALIDEARRKQSAANVDWAVDSIETFSTAPDVDLLYLGSSFQWVENHAGNLTRLTGLLSPHGVLAIQMPNMFSTPFYRSILEISESGPWSDTLRGKLRRSPVLPAEEYSRILEDLQMSFTIWTSTYAYPFLDVRSLLEWAKGAPLRPVCSALSRDSFNKFCDRYSDELARHYRSPDGTYTLPFERMFILATRQA